MINPDLLGIGQLSDKATLKAPVQFVPVNVEAMEGLTLPFVWRDAQRARGPMERADFCTL